MIKMLKRAKPYLIALTIPYLALMFLLIYRVEFELDAPGRLGETRDDVIFEGIDAPEASFYSIYIMPLYRPTFFQLMVATFDDAIDYRVLPEARRGQSISDIWDTGQVQRDNALNAAIINAYQALGFPLDYRIETMVTLVRENAADSGIRGNDIILSVNGDEDVRDALSNPVCDEPYRFSVRRNGDELTLTLTPYEENSRCIFGISIADVYVLVAYEPDFEKADAFVGGPSSGLMHFLHMYNTLSDDNLIGDLKIAGTGTIRLDGTVGSIGGVKQKVITAEHFGVDIMFVPNISHNRDTAFETAEKIEANVTIVPVDHWMDAVEYLKNLGEAND